MKKMFLYVVGLALVSQSLFAGTLYRFTTLPTGTGDYYLQDPASGKYYLGDGSLAVKPSAPNFTVIKSGSVTVKNKTTSATFKYYGSSELAGVDSSYAFEAPDAIPAPAASNSTAQTVPSSTPLSAQSALVAIKAFSDALAAIDVAAGTTALAALQAKITDAKSKAAQFPSVSAFPLAVADAQAKYDDLLAKLAARPQQKDLDALNKAYAAYTNALGVQAIVVDLSTSKTTADKALTDVGTAIDVAAAALKTAQNLLGSTIS